MKKILIIGGLLAIIGAGIGYSVYNKPHENMSSAKADLSVTAPELYSAYEADESAANAKYLDKTVEVSGQVMKVETDDAGKVGVTMEAGGLMGGVICKLDELSEHDRTTFATGEQVTFKGKCTGMLMDVVLERCVEVKKS